MRLSKAALTLAMLLALAIPFLALAQTSGGSAPAAAAPAKAAPAPAKMAPVSATTAAPAAKTTSAKAATSAEPAKAAKKEKGKEATSANASVTAKSIVGEVIDPACWVINGAKGEAHKDCALACAKAGQTLAILERKTNKVYILASSTPGEDPNKQVLDYCGKAVTVTGKVYTRGGLTAIRIASIAPYSATAAK
jgi:hypothetical protein